MELDKAILERALQRALRDGGDFADIFVEDRLYEGISATDGKIGSQQTGVQRGAALRVIRGETTALVYTEVLTEAGLLEAAVTAASVARDSSDAREITLVQRRPATRHNSIILPRDVPKQEKVDVVQRADAAARDRDTAVRRVTVYYVDNQQDILVANSEGMLAQDRRCKVRLQVQVTVGRGDRTATGTFAPGATSGFEFLRERPVEEVAHTAVTQALTILEAEPAPAGEMPVILAPGAGGIMFHEVAGHCLEGDSVFKQGSPYQNKIGQRVANPILSAVDDATVPQGWSSYGIDDEGTPGQRTMLIENGILRSYMTDRVSARQLGTLSTGNARRSSYRSLPLPRMSNTFILPGEHTPEEIISGTEHGLYAAVLTGGSVDAATGAFNFAINLGYRIRNGKLAEPVRDAVIMGTGVDVLLAVDAIGNDLQLLAGSCQKEGGRVSVGIGQPTVRIRSLQVTSRG